MTITAGLRWDYQRPYYLDGKRDPIIKDVLTGVQRHRSPASRCSWRKRRPASRIFTRNSFAPRLGVSYDVTGKGNTVLKGFYGRYYYNYADSFSDSEPGRARTTRRSGSSIRTATRVRRSVRSSALLVELVGRHDHDGDPNMKKPYADEFDLSVERQFWGESSVRVAYVRKNTDNEFATINLAREGQFTVPITVTVDTQRLRERHDRPNINLQSAWIIPAGADR